MEDLEDKESPSESFIHNSDWSFYDHDPAMRVIISMYFALTTLSTVGLGDFYPKSDFERVVGSFVLLIGVMTFSFIMGNMQTMVK